jgi:putative FmdB family regulatory protein
MPIYEYRCAACGHHLEALQKMTEAPLRKCPECGRSQLKRLVSASRFRLKGSGWYETDFKNKSETQRNLVEKGGAESASEAATDKSTDTSAKDGAGEAAAADKTVAAAKSDAAADKPAKPKAKPASATASRHAAKSRAKSRRK